MINLIVAMDENWLIGNSQTNDLPWPKISDDLKLFKRLTLEQMVVMGRNTFESFHHKPLPRRITLLLSKNLKWGLEQERKYEKVHCLQSLDEVINFNLFWEKDTWIIGGASVYKDMMCDYSKYINNIIISHIYGKYTGDLYFPKDNFYDNWTLERTLVSYPQFHTNIYKKLRPL